jgi:hypothetical protein
MKKSPADKSDASLDGKSLDNKSALPLGAITAMPQARQRCQICQKDLPKDLPKDLRSEKRVICSGAHKKGPLARAFSKINSS